MYHYPNVLSKIVENRKEVVFPPLEIIKVQKQGLLVILHTTSGQDGDRFGKSSKTHLWGTFCDGTISDIYKYKKFYHF